MQKSRTNAVRLFSCIRSILSSMCIPPISFQIIFFQGPLTRGGEIPRVAHFVRVFKHVSSAQTILRSSFATSAFTDAFFAIIPELYSGTFPQKSTFIKISLPLHLPNPPQVKDQGRTKDKPRNTQRTPNHQKVLFIKILTIEFAKESC